MTTGTPIKFEDGEAYERMMGQWSRLAGEIFLDWLAPTNGLRWVDVGCGTGAFSELVLQRCAPASLDGFDPSGGLLAYARKRLEGRAHVRSGDAMAAPYPDNSFDAAAMALVIFFVPEPARGVAEMARIVRPGGLVAAYAWDMMGGGFPLNALIESMREMGLNPPRPPRSDASTLDALRALWTGAGMVDVQTRTIELERELSFEELWRGAVESASLGGTVKSLDAAGTVELQQRYLSKMPKARDGLLTCRARANAVRGTVAGK